MSAVTAEPLPALDVRGDQQGMSGTLMNDTASDLTAAERDRMRATLETGAAAFSQDFDAELTRGAQRFAADNVRVNVVCPGVLTDGDDEDTEIDPYAAESPAEFLAVAVETFFEQPLDLRRRLAAAGATGSAEQDREDQAQLPLSQGASATIRRCHCRSDAAAAHMVSTNGHVPTIVWGRG